LGQAGAQILRASEKKELIQMAQIRKRKHDLIERLTSQKEELKYKGLEDKIVNEVNIGMMRSKLGPHI